MKILKKIIVPTGEIYTAQGEKGIVEFLTVGDYGKDANIKADFLGITRELNGVPNGEVESLSKKWVITISTQYGCSMNCKFCDVPKVGPGRNATYHDMLDSIKMAIAQHPEIEGTERLNIHFARMGEPSFNGNVLDVAACLRRNISIWDKCGTIHPVVSTMLPNNNKNLIKFLDIWTRDIKNSLYKGEAGLQFSINSTDNDQRDWLFSGNSLSLEEISSIGQYLPFPVGRKYALNFCLSDNTILDAKRLFELFDPNKFMVKLTPLHITASSTDNNIITTDGYNSFVPYKKAEEDCKRYGFDVIVFVPSLDEDRGMITCGNAILAGGIPQTKHEIIKY